MRRFTLLLCLSFLSTSLWAQTPERILIHISEQFQHKSRNTHIAEHLLRNLLKQAGYRVLDKAQLIDIKASQEALLVLSGDIDAAVAIDLQQDGDYILRGEANVTSGSRILGSKLVPRAANLGLELFSTKTGKILFADQFDARYPHIDALTGGKEALKMVADMAAESLLEVLSSGEKRMLEVVGLNRYGQIRQMRSQLKRLGYQVEILDFSKPKGVIAISGAIQTDLLADQIDAFTIDGRSLVIVELTPHKLLLELSNTTE